MRLYYALVKFFLTATIYGQIKIPVEYRLPASFLGLVQRSNVSIFGNGLVGCRLGNALIAIKLTPKYWDIIIFY
jgi:hypothetical protein